MDHDGKPDIICITDTTLRWYRNPDWKMFVIDKCVLHDIEVADFDGAPISTTIRRSSPKRGR